jgi:hypothetical protein
LTQQELLAQHQRRKDLYVLLMDAMLYGYPKMSVRGEQVWQIELFHQWRMFDPSMVKIIQDGLDILLPTGASFVCTTNDGLVERILVELGASRINSLNYFRLQRKDMRPDLPHRDGLVFEIHDYVPEVYHKAFADLMNQHAGRSATDTFRRIGRTIYWFGAQR